MLHWSTCNANFQRWFATHVFHTNLQTCYTFESLPTRSSTANIAKKSSTTRCYTWTIFRATSYHCKLALQVDQCNATFRCNPTPKSDQFQFSPAASPEILHHTVWSTWLFMANTRGKIILKILSTSPIHLSPRRPLCRKENPDRRRARWQTTSQKERNCPL